MSELLVGSEAGDDSTAGPRDEEGLRAAVEHLATLRRAPCSPGERAAAQWIAARLQELGCDATVEEERAFPAYAPALALLGAATVAAGLAALSGRGRVLPAALALASGTAIAQDADNRSRWLRRLVVRRRPTWNVVATAGDPAEARTLVVLAHHDAHPAGLVFDQALLRRLARRLPLGDGGGLPFWWPAIGAPALVALGALGRRRALTRAGVAGAAITTATALDLCRNRTVPGANDNLSAVAALIGLAAALAARPVPGVRVLLVSCGAEETLQGGIYGFLSSHRAELDPATTRFLNLEVLGARDHVLLDGEGPLRVADYAGAPFRDLVGRAAARAGVALRRGVRLRVSTDAVIPSRAGYPTATLMTLDDQRLIPNYHLMTDTPEKLDYTGIEGAIRIAEATVGELATEDLR